MRFTRLNLGVSILAATLAAAPAEDRVADREAIRAHVDKIFRAFISKDREAVRATHAENWRGFLEGSRQINRGIEQYMKSVGGNLASPYGMTDYKMRDFDIVFYGDTAFITYVADLDVKTPEGNSQHTLRVADLYVKQDGHWIQAGSNTAIHPDSIAEQLQMPQNLSEPGVFCA